MVTVIKTLLKQVNLRGTTHGFNNESAVNHFNAGLWLLLGVATAFFSLYFLGKKYT